MQGYTISKGGTITGRDGSVIFFDYDRFSKEIYHSGHCFVCGKSPKNGFNREHVFPDWLLRHCGLYDQEITLPNLVKTRYSTYRIRCCAQCNSRLGVEFEEPVRDIIAGGFDRVLEYVHTEGPQLLQLWMALIFLKVHLKDRSMIINKDARSDRTTIGQMYDLDALHHVHALARARLFGIEIDPNVFGTFIVAQASRLHCPTTFNYADNYLGRSIMIRVKDVVMYNVIDDCGIVQSMLVGQLDNLPQSMNDIQILELLVRLTCASMHISSQPLFRTAIDIATGKAAIQVERPEPVVQELDRELLGSLMEGTMSQFEPELMREGKVADLQSGLATTLWDADFKPITQPTSSVPPRW
jgi:hypothetical protein